MDSSTVRYWVLGTCTEYGVLGSHDVCAQGERERGRRAGRASSRKPRQELELEEAAFGAWSREGGGAQCMHLLEAVGVRDVVLRRPEDCKGGATARAVTAVAVDSWVDAVVALPRCPASSLLLPCCCCL